MIETDIESSWNGVRELTATMHGLVAAEEWDKVLELSAQRHQRVVGHFADFPVGPENSEFYRNQIHEMLEGEKELHSLVIEARKQVMRAAMTSNQNHRAVNAYLRSARG
jgi:hypothetical protein